MIKRQPEPSHDALSRCPPCALGRNVISFWRGDGPNAKHCLHGCARNESENVPKVGSFCTPGSLSCVWPVRLDLSLRLLGPPRRRRRCGPGRSLHQRGAVCLGLSRGSHPHDVGTGGGRSFHWAMARERPSTGPVETARNGRTFALTDAGKSPVGMRRA